MKKLLTLVLTVAFALCLFVPAFASAEPSAEPVGGKSVEDAFVDYIHEWLLAELAINSNMTIEQVEDEFMPLVEAGDYVSFPAEMLWSGMLEQGVPMTFEEFAAQYVPEGGAAGGVTPGEYTDGANVLVIADDLTFVCTTAGENMDGAAFSLTIKGTVAEDGTVTVTSLADGEFELIDMASPEQLAKDTATVESLVALAMTAGDASGEASGEAASDEEAYIEYIHEWLLAELAVNSNMTIEQVEDEFMPLIEAGDYTSFPAEMLWSGMLNNGVAMTFDEFVASR